MRNLKRCLSFAVTFHRGNMRGENPLLRLCTLLFFKLVREALDAAEEAYLYLDGSTPMKLRMHRTKRDLADSLLEGTDMSHKLTNKDLLEMLSNEYF